MAGFEPEWRGVFEHWTRSYMRVHHWKIRYQMDFDDAVQECAVIFAWCLRKTTSRGGRIDNVRWFMRYYQRAVGTWMITQATKDTQRRETLATLQQERADDRIDPDALVVASLRNDASAELQTVLRAIITAPTQFIRDLLLQPAPDHIWSRRLCRLCGIPVNENIVGELKKLLSE